MDAIPLNTNPYAFNYDTLWGYLFGGFTYWAISKDRWFTLAAVSLIFLFALAADVPRDFL